MKKAERNMRRAPNEDAIGQIAVNDTKRNIEQGIDADGKRLRPLSEKTIRNRQLAGIPGTRPLIASGRLLRSITFEERRRGRGSVIIVKAKTREDTLKLVINQTGSTNAPDRAVLGASRRMQRAIRDNAIKEMRKQLRRSLR